MWRPEQFNFVNFVKKAHSSWYSLHREEAKRKAALYRVAHKELLKRKAKKYRKMVANHFIVPQKSIRIGHNRFYMGY